MKHTFAVILFAVSTLVGCIPNMVLRNTTSAGASGPLQRCPMDNGACAADPNQDASRFNNSGTRNFTLPNCPNGIDSILIEGGNTAVVQCAAPSPSSGGTTTATTGTGTTDQTPSTSTVTNP